MTSGKVPCVRKGRREFSEDVDMLSWPFLSKNKIHATPGINQVFFKFSDKLYTFVSHGATLFVLEQLVLTEFLREYDTLIS